jgi:hypothetical protein
MRRLHREWWVVLVLGIALLTAGCGDDDDDSDDDDNDDNDDSGDDSGDDDTGPDVQDLLDEGRYWLGVGEGNRAGVAFRSALDLVPDQPEALYGLTLADDLALTDVVGIIKDYLSSFLDNGGPVGAAKDGSDPDSILDRLLELVINGLVLEKAQELRDTAVMLQATPEPGYVHEGIPVVVDFELAATLAGEFDRGEVIGGEAYGELLYGLLGHAVTLSLETDISLAFLFTLIDFSDTQVAIGDAIDILHLLLSDPGHPGFLTMSPAQMEVYKTLGPNLGDGMDAFVRMWPAIDSEADAQTDDVFRYVDANGNGARDPDEVYDLPYFGVLDGDGMGALALFNGLAFEWRAAFWDRTPKDLNPGAPDPLRLAALNPILAHFGLPAVIPESLTIPVGDWYAEPQPTQIRDFLANLVAVLDPLLPGSGRFESD